MSSNKLGKGIIFPVELTNGAPVIRDDSTLITSSIKLILGWPYRDRFFLANYGSRLEELLEEPNDDITLNLIQFFIFDSIRRWEPRVKLKNTDVVERDQEKLQILIEYTIVESETEESFIYPFYKTRLV